MGALFSCLRFDSGKRKNGKQLAWTAQSDARDEYLVAAGAYQSPPRTEVKLLFLGESESGKSTFAKQLKLLLTASGRTTFRGFSDSERRLYRRGIYSNVVTGMEKTLKAMADLRISFMDPARDRDRHLFAQLSQQLKEGELPRELADIMLRLWRDGGFQQCVQRSNEYKLNDSALYFLNALDRIAANDYWPTDEDVLKTRVKSYEPTEMTVVNRSFRFRVIDFGDQPKERKKMIECFSAANAIVFFVALSDYDVIEHMEGENSSSEKKNRVRKAMDYFASVCNNKLFDYANVFLLLNKTDVFEAKLAKTPLSSSFPAYKGNNTASDSCDFIREKFERLNQRGRKVHTYSLCATKTGEVRAVWEAIVDSIEKETMDRSSNHRQ